MYEIYSDPKYDISTAAQTFIFLTIMLQRETSTVFADLGVSMYPDLLLTRAGLGRSHHYGQLQQVQE